MKVLTAENMAEPTAAPDGFSVRVGAGSGLAPAEYNLTGSSSNGTSGGGDGRISAPLLSPPPVDPSITTASRPHQQHSLPQHDVSQSMQQPRPYVPNTNRNDDHGEADIYIPGIASVRLNDTSIDDGGSATIQSNCDRHDSNNDDNQNDSNGGKVETSVEIDSTGFEEESYEDLAARFARLQK